jgi:hypothetical protein
MSAYTSGLQGDSGKRTQAEEAEEYAASNCLAPHLAVGGLRLRCG